MLRAPAVAPFWRRDFHLVLVLTCSGAIPLRRLARYIRIMSAVGRIVSLDDVREGRRLARVNFVLIFEGSAHDGSGAARFLPEGVPYAVSLAPGPNTGVAPGATEVEHPNDTRGGDAEVRSPAVTLVNGLRTAAPGNGSSRAVVLEEIERATAAFVHITGHRPAYYAVPWTSQRPSLAVDVQEGLRRLGYRGALWDHSGGNLPQGVFIGRLMNLTRVACPSNGLSLLRLVLDSLRHTHHTMLDWLPPEELSPEAPWTIDLGTSPERLLAFENIMRESRDYASDPAFYDYLFTRNPYKGIRPDYRAVVTDDHIGSVGYHFHMRFLLMGRSVDGLSWSSWRSLPGHDRTANGFPLMQALSAEPIVGAYRPSPIAEEALRSRHWKRIAVDAVALDLRRSAGQPAGGPGGQITESAHYPSTLDELVGEAGARYRFTICRSPQFYRWRLDQYPLADSRYFVLSRHGRAVAYFALLQRGLRISVADFYCPTLEDFVVLVQHALLWGRGVGAAQLMIETSIPEFSRWLSTAGGTAASRHFNYYHFNRARLSSTEVIELLDRWDTTDFHETPVSGDVLLR